MDQILRLWNSNLHLICLPGEGRRDARAEHERAAAVGLPAAAAERLDGAVRALHHVEGQGDGRVQDRGPGGAGQAVGHPEEPPLHELRQDVAGAALLLQGQHTQEGPGRATLLPVSTVNRASLKGGLEVGRFSLPAYLSIFSLGCMLLN